MKFFDYLKEITEAYKAHLDDAPALREAYCVEIINRYVFLPPEEKDLVAGRKRTLEVGFSNEPLLGRSVCWFYDEFRAMESLKRENATDEEMAEAREMLAFWKEHETRKNLRDSYPDYIKEAMPFDVYWEHSQISFPLYRVVGAYMDYPLLLKNGIGGMKSVVTAKMLKAKERNIDISLYKGCLMVLDSLTQVCLWYAEEAEKQGKTEMAINCRNISVNPPATFTEALQLHWIYSLASGVLNYGRMDEDLGDYLAADLATGKITEQKALDYLCSLWVLVDARKTVFHGRIIIGGKGRHNEKNADQFAMLAMKASNEVAEMEPQLSLRFYEGQNPELMDYALSVIGQGKVYPMLYNDDVNIPSVKNAFEVSEEEAEDYCFFGCGEYVLNHRSMGSPNGIINLLKALESTIFNGEDLKDGRIIGMQLGSLTDYETFDDFYNAYKKQISNQFRMLALLEKMEYDFCAKEGAFLYISMLMDDCLDRGLSVCGGGCRYLGGTLETYGNINTSNSLYAIKTVVYEKKLITRQRLMDALRANFEGYEEERKLLTEAEKYGNDLDNIDNFAIGLHEYICNTVRDLKDYNGLHSYMIVMINNEANTVLGRFTGASADGRLAYTPMANANNPYGGSDKNGLTAMLNSLAKLRTDIHAGSVQNMTFSKELFSNRDLVKKLLGGYFKKGGSQAMINVLNRGDLEDAMAHPERHQNLMVRVGGFSARFVTLQPDVQREIASRTLY